MVYPPLAACRAAAENEKNIIVWVTFIILWVTFIMSHIFIYFRGSNLMNEYIFDCLINIVTR